eukprot:s5820_g1.t1
MQGISFENQPLMGALQMSGGPGTGKTEVIVAAALEANSCRKRVLLCALDEKVQLYLYRLQMLYGPRPGTSLISIDSTRKAFSRGREAALPFYDLIILEEVHRMDEALWHKVKMALLQVSAGPFLVFVGDLRRSGFLTNLALLDLCRARSAGPLHCVDMGEVPRDELFALGSWSSMDEDAEDDPGKEETGLRIGGF